MTDKEVMQQALAALRRVNAVDNDCDILSLSLSETVMESIESLCAAIAQPEQKEPVRQPLTRRVIQTIVIDVCDTIYSQDDTSYSEADSVFYGAFTRAIEAAHGIAQLVQPAPLKGHEIAQAVNALRDVALEYYGSKQLRERIAHIVVPLLQAVQPVKNKA